MWGHRKPTDARARRGTEYPRGLEPGGQGLHQPYKVWQNRHTGLVPCGEDVVQRVPGGIHIAMLSGDTNPYPTRGATVLRFVGVNIDKEGAPIPLAAVYLHHVERKPSGRRCVEKFGCHDLPIMAAARPDGPTR